MFERKNQNILSKHFTKLIDHDSDDANDSDDDFITLKRADHELNEEELPEHDFTSKRKQKLATSKKAIGKYGAKGHKLVFDEDGVAHEIYEMKTTEEVFKEADVKEVGRQFMEAERGRLREADVEDKAVAKEKRQEKKRKRKERERDVCVPANLDLRPVLTTKHLRHSERTAPQCLPLPMTMTTVTSAQTSIFRQPPMMRMSHHLRNVLNPRKTMAKSRHWPSKKSSPSNCYGVEDSFESFVEWMYIYSCIIAGLSLVFSANQAYPIFHW